MIGVSCRVETAGDTVHRSLLIENHWRDDDLVVLVIDEKDRRVFKGSELITAIKNCMRVGNCESGMSF